MVTAAANTLFARTADSRIAIAVPTPGVTVSEVGAAYVMAEEALAALPLGATAHPILVPMNWAADERRAVLQAKPIFSRCSLDVGDGWLVLIERLVAGIEALSGGELVRVSQVKEKFGRLRFYLDRSADGTGGLINAAEAESGCTCHWCGDAGKTVSLGGWYTTLCQRHQAIAPLIRNDIDHDNWRHWLRLPKDLPTRPNINRTWAVIAQGADQLQSLGIEAIGIGVPGDQWPLEAVGVSVWTRAGADAAEVWPVALNAIHHLLDGWPVRQMERSACHRWMRLDDRVERRRAVLAVHRLMACGAKIKLGDASWLPVIEQLLGDLSAGVPDGRIKAIRPAQDGRLSVHPTLRGEAGKLVLAAAEKTAGVETGRAG